MPHDPRTDPRPGDEVLIRMNGHRPAYSMIVEELVLDGVRYRTKANQDPGSKRGAKWIPIKEWRVRVRNAEVVRNSEEVEEDGVVSDEE